MNAEIIAVGTELLLGDILNTNAQYLSRELAGLGIGVYYQTCVGDNAERLMGAYEVAFGRADIVITTGGLGPTEDDLTKETAARYFGKQLVMHEESLNRIVDIFKTQCLTMTESNRKQALIPEGARTLANDNGTAPGIMLEQDGKILIMMPGPPNELMPMFANHVAPEFAKRSGQTFVSTVMRLCGVGESAAEERIKDLIDAQTNPTIAPYAKTFEVHFRLTAAAATREEAVALIQPLKAELYNRFGRDIYAEDGTTLEAAVCTLLAQRKLTIATAESCTGGLLAARIVDNPGASAVFVDGVIAYSNEAKTARLGVKPETLERHGAVSRETAMEMAEGAARSAGAGVGLSITGVAGPGGGSDEKPVGRVYIGIHLAGVSSSMELNLRGNRTKVRARSAAIALDYLRRTLLDHAAEQSI
ncbi:MAG: competence/damage-inducible protein A, partial [Defluviitaleaceae bacterium]|nr:competence/damage-inducible protein A [Defluviitaleaceae bacterium]